MAVTEPEPNPLTPDVWLDAALDELDLSVRGSELERDAIRCALHSLRDMLASRDAEIDRLTDGLRKLQGVRR